MEQRLQTETNMADDLNDSNMADIANGLSKELGQPAALRP